MRLSPAQGAHGRTSYVKLMIALKQSKANGVVAIQFRRRSRQIYLLGGEPVSYRSDLPEESVDRTLVTSNLVPADRLKWMKDRLSADENLTDALLMSGALTEEALNQHLVQRMHIGLGASLAWTSGEWTFQPQPQILAERIDPALIPRTNLLPCLWNGVKQYVNMEEILSAVSDPGLGKMIPTPELSQTVEMLDLEGPQGGLAEAIGDGCTMDDLFTRIPDTTGTLVKLIWFLGEIEQIQWENGKAASALAMLKEAETDQPFNTTSGPTKPRPASSAGSSRTSSNQSGSSTAERVRARPNRPISPMAGRTARDRASAKDINKVIANDYKRIERDFYGFLGIADNASEDQIRLQCKRVAKRWQTAKANPKLQPEGQDQVKDLLAGASLVWKTLGSEKSRAEYLRRAESGRAPTVRGALPTTFADRNMGAPLEAPDSSNATESESPSPGATHSESSRVRTLMDGEQYTQAIPLLQRARMENPSDPETLADLGWAMFRTIGAGHPDDEDSAEDFVALALTFDPRNTRALEYWAKIALETGNKDEAKRRLKSLLKVQPKTNWARPLIENEAALQQAIDDAIRRRRNG